MAAPRPKDEVGGIAFLLPEDRTLNEQLNHDESSNKSNVKRPKSSDDVDLCTKRRTFFYGSLKESGEIIGKKKN